MAKKVSKAATATTEKTNVKVADTKKNNVKKTATKVDTKVAEPETTAAAPAVKKPAVKKTDAAAPAVKAEKKTKKTATAAVKKAKVEKPAVKAEKKSKKTATAAPAPKAEKKSKKTTAATPAVKAEKKSKVKAEKKTKVEKLDVVEVGLVCHVIKVAFDNGKKNRGHYSYLGKPTIDYLTGIGVTWKATGKHGYNFNVPRKNTKTFNKVMAIAEKFEGIALD